MPDWNSPDPHRRDDDTVNVHVHLHVPPGGIHIHLTEGGITKEQVADLLDRAEKLAKRLEGVDAQTT